jgi:membrane-associated HD superfamily phosphohydrolase
VGLLLFTGSALDTADLICFGLLRLYEYHPHLLSGKQDVFLGEVLAEVLYVPMLYSVVALLPHQVRFAGAASLGLILAGIEYLFIALGIFHHHGWAWWSTPVLFTLFSAVAAAWVNAFERAGYTRLHRFIVLLTATNLSWHALSLFYQRLLQRGWSELALLTNSESNQIVGTVLEYGIPYHLITLVLVWTVRKPSVAAAAAGALLFTAWLKGLDLAGVYHNGPVLLDGIGLGAAVWGLSKLDQWFTRAAGRNRPRTRRTAAP